MEGKGDPRHQSHALGTQRAWPWHQTELEFMSDEALHSAMATWAAKDLPARLDVGATAKLLGFTESDIQVLMSSGKVTPLGDPAPNAPKWFAAVQMIHLATDQEWLHKATKEIAKYWRNKRERRHSRVPLQRPILQSTANCGHS